MLQPGTYSDMQIKANHTFAPGIYTIDGGSLKVAAQYNLSGSGVIFVLKNGATIDINGGSNISFTAPTSDQITASPGTYNNISSEFGGVLIFEDKATSVRSEEHTSELQSLMRISYAVFCLKKKKNTYYNKYTRESHSQQYSINTTNKTNNTD